MIPQEQKMGMQSDPQGSQNEHLDGPFSKLNGLKYAFATHSEQLQPRERASPSSKFQEKVKAKRKKQRRLISTSSVEAEGKRKLRKFETATKETLRRFKSSVEDNESSGIDNYDDDHFGQLISSADWEKNKMELISSVCSSKEEGDRRKRKIMKEISQMQAGSVHVVAQGTVELTSSGIDFEEVDRNMKHDSSDSKLPEIDDIVKTSPFYRLNAEFTEQEELQKNNKSYFVPTGRMSEHADAAIVGIDEAKALYDTSLNLSEWGSFIKSQLSEDEEDTSPRILSFSQLRPSASRDQRGSVIEINDSYDEGDLGEELVETLGTQKEPISLDSSQKENLIEIPNTSENGDQEDKLTIVNEVIEIENSTDDDDDDNNNNNETYNTSLVKLIPTSSPIISVHNTPLKERLIDIPVSPVKNAFSRQTTMIEVPSSEPLSPSKDEDNQRVVCNSKSDQEHSLHSDASPGKVHSEEVVDPSQEEFKWDDEDLHDSDKEDEIGASQTQVVVEDGLQCGEDDGTPMELAIGEEEVYGKFETLIKDWPVEVLAKQMQVWGLKPVKSRVGMVRALCEISTMIPTEKLAWVIERNESHCVIDFTKYEESGGSNVGDAEAEVGRRLRQVLIQKLVCDAEIKEAIATYKPLELEWVCSRVEPSWEGLTLDRHWVSMVLDELGVCWTPLNSAKIS